MKYLLMKKYITEDGEIFYDKLMSFASHNDVRDMQSRLNKMYPDSIFTMATECLRTSHNKDCAVTVAEQPSPKSADADFAQS